MTYEIKITVTPKGKKYDIETVFPMDVRVGELIDLLDSARQSLAKAGFKFMERHHQLTEPEKQEIAQNLTLRQIADDANGY